jgi:serine/threonine protein kinase
MSKSDDHNPVEDRYLEHAIAEYLRRLDQGEVVDRAQFLKEHADCADGLREYFEAVDQVERMAGPHVQQKAGGEPAAGHPDAGAPRAPDAWDHKKFPFSFGRYKVLRRLGQGGMGTVYLAHDTQMDREVALKIPQLDAQKHDRKWLERFVREARASVQHPNICTVYDTDIHDGQPFISMAYIKGKPLAALINPDKLLPEDEIAILVRIVAVAMHAAHQAGIVHRDLKPSNIMIDEEGHPFIMDFGLAYRLTGDVVRLTSNGRVVGTPAYMSPEQVERNPDGVTHSTDIYSLGVTFYELLTGWRPFQGTLPQLLKQIHDKPPEPPSRLRHGLHRGLEVICLRMMAKNALDRFDTMKAVADELDGWLKQNTAQSGAASELQLLRQQVKMLSIGGAVAVGGLGLFEIVELLGSHFSGGGEPHSEGHPSDELHPHSPSHDGGWHSPFEDHLPEHAPVEKADPHFGTPDHDRAFWEGQQSYADTCAIRCQEYILQQFTGVDFPEKLLVDEAREHGWYAPGHGTSIQDVGNLLELHGVAVNRYTEANVFHLANELAQGHKVIIGVDSSQLWGHNSTMDSMLHTVRDHFGLGGGADHAVVVSGIDTTDPHHVKVIISDPGDGKAVASYPMEQFLHAWEGSHFYMVATQEPAPAHLPEMVHFDYAAGHVGAIADVPYEQFVEQFAHHPEALEHALDHFTDEHGPDSAAPADHDPHGHHHPDLAGHDHHEIGFHDDHHGDGHHGVHDLADHHGHDAHNHDDIAPHYEEPGHDDHQATDDYSDLP